MNLAMPKVGGCLDQLLEVGIVEHVAGHGNGATAGGIDALGDGLGFGYRRSVSAGGFHSPNDQTKSKEAPWPTTINIGHDYLGALVGKEPGCLGANALARPCDDGGLTGQHALGVIELTHDLLQAVCHSAVRRRRRVTM